MFYENENYTVLSEYVSPEYKMMTVLTVFCDDKHENCPVCGSPMKKDGKKHRTILDYNEEKCRIEQIKLSSQRYICTNPDCRNYILSGTPLGRSSHTKAFDWQFAYRIFAWEFDTFTECEKIFGLSHTTLSNITHRHLKDLHLHFRPPELLEILYLCPFIYQDVKRYYLGAVDRCGNHMLLEFFGYKDARKEALRYFQFLWKDCDRPYTQVLWGDGENTYSEAGILVDTDCEFINEINLCFDDLHVFYIPNLLDKKIEANKKDTNEVPLNTSALFVTRLKNRLEISDSEKSFDERSKDLKEWWEEQSENIKKQMEELWNTLDQGSPEIFMSYMYRCLKFATVDKLIYDHNLNKTSFEIMVARMMYRIHDDYIFTEDEEDIFDEEDFDDENPDPFSGKLPPLPNLNKKIRKIYTDKSTGIFYRQPRHYAYTRSYFPWNREPVTDITDVDIAELLEELPFPEDYIQNPVEPPVIEEHPLYEENDFEEE